jgi:hypothetical protein
MIQFYSNDELFQFPVVVVVKNNQAREALLTNDEISADSPICQTRNQQVQVSTYDLDLNPVEASLRFSCLTDSCDVGTTTQKLGSSSAIVDLPQCVNAVLTAYAEGYAPANYILSTNTETKADILMKKIYDVKVDLGNVASASVVFSSEDYSAVLNYPEDREVSLIEGEYNITAYVYKNSTIVFPAINDRKCVEVASTSFAGLLGDSTEQCFDINIPSQEVDMALVGGGRGYDYFTETQFKDGKELNLNIPLFKTPTNLEELQNNYITWEDASLDTRWE